MRSAFGQQASANPRILEDETFYTKGPYSAYLGPWSRMFDKSLQRGDAPDQYRNTLTFLPDEFPRNVRLDWRFPTGKVPNGIGVWGYLALSYGNYDGGPPQTPVKPCQVRNLGAFEMSFDWAFSGSRHFGLLTELWLTRDPRPTAGSSADALAEIGFLLHTPDLAFHNSGRLVGRYSDNGIAYTARSHGKYVTFAPVGGPVMTGRLDWKAALDFLVERGIISGDEWINGVAFGVEPNKGGGAGITYFKSWSVTLEGRTETSLGKKER